MVPSLWIWFLVVLWSPLPEKPIEIPEVLVLDDVAIIDVVEGGIRENMTVTIRGDRIESIQRKSDAKPPPSAEVVAAAGKVLIPGLWDMHVHITMARESSLPLFVAHGVTAVREMGGNLEEVLAYRDRVRKGVILGPHLKISGAVIESSQFLGALKQLRQMEPDFADEFSRLVTERVAIRDPDHAREFVKKTAAQGVDFLKIRSVGSREIFLALAREAAKYELPLVGHVPVLVDLAEAAREGQRSFEHSFWGFKHRNRTEAQKKELFRSLAESGAAFTPTLITDRGYRLTPDHVLRSFLNFEEGDNLPHVQERPLLSRRLLDSWRMQLALKKYEGAGFDWVSIHEEAKKDILLLLECGVPILAGTDVGAPLVIPGASLHDELEMFVSDVGMSTLQALQSATVNAARFVGEEEDRGTVEEGKIADLVLLGGNPLENINHIRDVESVILRGKMLDKSRIVDVRKEVRSLVEAGN